jgi:hypothetical protein
MPRPRVVERDGAAVILKVCAGPCGEEKVCSHVPEESAFHTRREDGRIVGWQSYCKECAVTVQLRWRRDNPEKLSALRARRHAERMATDAEYRDKRARRRRAYWERLKADPVRLRAYLDRKAEAERERKAADPEGYNETKRMEYALRRERMGKPIHVRGPRGYGGRLEAWPFVSWLLAYREEIGAETDEELARDLGIVARRVNALLSGAQDHVSFDVVDHALQHARFPIVLDGELIVRLDDLYPVEEEVAA